MQRAWKENCRAGNIKHGSPEAERSMGFLGTQEECVCVMDPAKVKRVTQGKIAESAGSGARKMLLKDLGFILKGTKKSLEGFKQGNGMT